MANVPGYASWSAAEHEAGLKALISSQKLAAHAADRWTQNLHQGIEYGMKWRAAKEVEKEKQRESAAWAEADELYRKKIKKGEPGMNIPPQVFGPQDESFSAALSPGFGAPGEGAATQPPEYRGDPKAQFSQSYLGVPPDEEPRTMAPVLPPDGVWPGTPSYYDLYPERKPLPDKGLAPGDPGEIEIGREESFARRVEDQKTIEDFLYHAQGDDRDAPNEYNEYQIDPSQAEKHAVEIRNPGAAPFDRSQAEMKLPYIPSDAEPEPGEVAWKNLPAIHSDAPFDRSLAEMPYVEGGGPEDRGVVSNLLLPETETTEEELDRKRLAWQQVIYSLDPSTVALLGIRPEAMSDYQREVIKDQGLSRERQDRIDRENKERKDREEERIDKEDERQARRDTEDDKRRQERHNKDMAKAESDLTEGVITERAYKGVKKKITAEDTAATIDDITERLGKLGEVDGLSIATLPKFIEEVQGDANKSASLILGTIEDAITTVEGYKDGTTKATLEKLGSGLLPAIKALVKKVHGQDLSEEKRKEPWYSGFRAPGESAFDSRPLYPARKGPTPQTDPKSVERINALLERLSITGTDGKARTYESLLKGLGREGRPKFNFEQSAAGASVK